MLYLIQKRFTFPTEYVAIFTELVVSFTEMVDKVQVPLLFFY